MKKGIIFDMDGTLWDSAEQVAQSWTLALQQCGYGDAVVTKEDCIGQWDEPWIKLQRCFFHLRREKTGRHC